MRNILWNSLSLSMKKWGANEKKLGNSNIQRTTWPPSNCSCPLKRRRHSVVLHSRIPFVHFPVSSLHQQPFIVFIFQLNSSNWFAFPVFSPSRRCWMDNVAFRWCAVPFIIPFILFCSYLINGAHLNFPSSFKEHQQWDKGCGGIVETPFFTTLENLWFLLLDSPTATIQSIGLKFRSDNQRFWYFWQTSRG